MGWSEPKRTRTAVRYKSDHVGYVTTVGYPGRDLTAFSEGSPYSEVVISDLNDRHVALLQRYKEHWLVQCGAHYRTTDRPGELSDRQVMRLAVFALLQAGEPAGALVDALKARLDGMLAGWPRPS